MSRRGWGIAAPVDDSQSVRRSLMTAEAPRAVLPPKPKVVYRGPTVVGLSVEEVRERSRQGLEVHFDGRFDLVAELRALAAPTAEAAALVFAEGRYVVPSVEDSQKRVLVFRREVDGWVVAVHETRRSVLSMLGHARGLSGEVRERLREAVGAPVPVVSDGDVVSGVWLDVLADHLAPLSEDLAGLLARSPAPNDWSPSAQSYELREALSPLFSAARDVKPRVRGICMAFESLFRREQELAMEEARRAEQRRVEELKLLGLS